MPLVAFEIAGDMARPAVSNPRRQTPRTQQQRDNRHPRPKQQKTKTARGRIEALLEAGAHGKSAQQVDSEKPFKRPKRLFEEEASKGDQLSRDVVEDFSEHLARKKQSVGGGGFFGWCI